MAFSLGRSRVAPLFREEGGGRGSKPAPFARLSSVRHRYPFEAVHWLRQRRVEQQATLVGESVAKSARAQVEQNRAEATRQRSESAMAALTCSERERLGDGLTRVADLQSGGDWRKGAEARLRTELELEQRARAARLEQAAAEVLARRALGEASNAARLIDTHRSSFRAERAAAEELSEEEAATEQWTAQRFPPRRS